MWITCGKEPMTVKARSCPLDEFDEVASKLKERKQVIDIVFLDKLHASAKSAKGASWGARSGTEDDRVGLNEIISAELIKTENHGDCFGCLNESNL